MDPSSLQLSIIVPTYNCAGYLKRCLASLVEQRNTELEILVCDDASTDETGDFLRTFSRRYPQVRSFSISRHCGSPAIPRNIGLAHAKGEYVGFVDADDWVEESMFDNLLRAAGPDKPDVVSASHFFLHEKGQTEKFEINYAVIRPGQSDRSNFGGNFSQVLHRIYRTDFLRRHHITFPFLRISEDFCFSAACHFLAGRTEVAPSGGYHYNRTRHDSTTFLRQGAVGIDNINFFSHGVRYFEQIGIWKTYAALIFKAFLPSLDYTHSRLAQEYAPAFEVLLHRELKRHSNILNSPLFDTCAMSMLERLGVHRLSTGEIEFSSDTRRQTPLLPCATQLFSLGDYGNARRIYEVVAEKNPPLKQALQHSIARAATAAIRSDARLWWQPTRVGHAQTPLTHKYAIKEPAQSLTGRYTTWPSTTKLYEGGRRVNGANGKQKQNFPLVSIITTVKNGANHLEQCIQSVFAQTYPHIEYLVIDAASSDASLLILQRHGENIDYILCEEDKGLYSGLNKGLMLAQGDYHLVLNSDDYLEDHAIASLLDAAKARNADVVFGSATLLGPDDQAVGTKPSGWDASVFVRCPARHGAMLARSAAYSAAGLYDESKKIIGDLLWMQKAYQRGLRVHIVDLPVFNFRLGGISTPSDPSHLAELLGHLCDTFPDVEKTVLMSLCRAVELTEEQITAIAHAYPSNVRLTEALEALIRSKVPANADQQ